MSEIIDPIEDMSICKGCSVRRVCARNIGLPNCAKQVFSQHRGVNWNAALKAVEGAGSATTNTQKPSAAQIAARI